MRLEQAAIDLPVANSHSSPNDGSELINAFLMHSYAYDLVQVISSSDYEIWRERLNTVGWLVSPSATAQNLLRFM